MKKTTTLAAALAVGATGAFAGGADRSGQSIAAIFEDGDYVEFSLGIAMPTITGTLGAFESGDIAPTYTQLGFATKTDLSDKFSLGLILDQPFGADVDYADAGYPLTGTNAKFSTSAITVLGKYNVSERISVYAGPRIVTGSGNVTLVPPTAYANSYESDMDIGYVIGAAYEIPDIALRAALTYSSATEYAMTGIDIPTATLTAAMPQTVNLEFQTGIAANTLLMASVRWADWSEAHITDDLLPAPLTEFGNADTFTYSLGIGRKFSEKFSGSASIGYEKSTGAPTGNLAPTDGFWSLAVGGAYDLGNGAKISGGVRYVQVGDATTTIAAEFEDNSVLAVGLKFSQSF